MENLINYSDLPRKAKKSLKRMLMKTIDPAWKSKEVRIKTLRPKKYRQEVSYYKNLCICSYELG